MSEFLDRVFPRIEVEDIEIPGRDEIVIKTQIGSGKPKYEAFADRQEALKQSYIKEFVEGLGGASLVLTGLSLVLVGANSLIDIKDSPITPAESVGLIMAGLSMSIVGQRHIVIHDSLMKEKRNQIRHTRPLNPFD